METLPAETEEWYCSANCRQNHAENKTAVTNIEMAAMEKANTNANKKSLPRYIFIYVWIFVKLFLLLLILLLLVNLVAAQREICTNSRNLSPWKKA